MEWNRLLLSMRRGMDELARLTIAQAAVGIRDRRFSATELLTCVLQRAADTEPRLHAYARLMTERAYHDAGQADREIGTGRWRGALHGIPIGVRDLCFTAGVPTEAGSRAMRGFVPDIDARVVRLLRDAGAVIVGKTVTHEFAYGQNIPPTRNPWDETMYPGGSSVGSAVATAVGSAMAAIGTDTTGSVRLPASMNGIVGLKPTFGRVSRYGVIALSPSLDHVGPLARTVEDCGILLAEISGHDPLDPSSASSSVPGLALTDLDRGVSGLRLGVEREYFHGLHVDREVLALIESAERELEEAGARLVRVSIPPLDRALIIGLTLLQPEASDLHRSRLRSRADDYEPGTRLRLEFGRLIPAHHYASAVRARRWFQLALHDVFRERRLDALVAPTSPVAALPLEQSVGDYLGRTSARVDLSELVRHGVVASIAGLPALTVPCGLTRQRLPVGLQIIGRPFDEDTVLRIGRTYENRTNWDQVRQTVLMEA